MTAIRRLVDFPSRLAIVLTALAVVCDLRAVEPRPLVLSPPAVVDVDHVPIAVVDLDGASDQFRKLGFTLKEGRPHTNGIRNRHAKFPNGTEIELITAPAAVDPLTRQYRDHLRRGDGPAFLALFATPYEDVASTVQKAGFSLAPEDGLVTMAADGPLPYLFFSSRMPSPTDRPEHFVHANTAASLTKVWLAADDFSNERRLLTAMGAQFRVEAMKTPFATDVVVAQFAEGAILMLPGRFQTVQGRRIVGVSVAVRDVDRASRVVGELKWNGSSGERTGAERVFVAPERAAGAWIEFYGVARD